MNSFVVGICSVAALLCAARMAWPVGRAQKAYLLALAHGDSECEEIADKAIARKWLAWTHYEDAAEAIKHIKIEREHDSLLAESAAREAVRRAKNYVDVKPEALKPDAPKPEAAKPEAVRLRRVK